MLLVGLVACDLDGIHGQKEKKHHAGASAAALQLQQACGNHSFRFRGVRGCSRPAT